MKYILICVFAVIAMILAEYFANLDVYNSEIRSIRNNYKNVVSIDLNKFVKFYKVNPKKYDFSKINTKFKYIPNPILYHPKNSLNSDSYELIFLKYREYKKFLRFYKKLKEKMNDNISDETMMGYLNDVQKDINNLKRQAKSYVDESLEIVNEVKNRRKNNV